ncbi:TPA: GNAT family N-acetyltransferase [Candidatus Bathyarchaeota archaeon]|nr:GNAT family N-acetyltransferase [Candidatus Bathyarchaeota archaeon]
MKQRASFKIREANKKDIPIIMDLAKQLAIYEKSPESFVATRDDYEKWGWGPDAIFKVLLAENTRAEGPKYVGFALYYFTFSTWTGRPTLWLEDVFVPEELRGSGVGSALLGRLARIALDKGCGRMEWTCLDWNEPSRQFYFRLGATAQNEWTTFRLTPRELEKLAK